MPLKIYNLHYSRLLSVPLLGWLCYRLQSELVACGLLHHCWMSRRQSPARHQLWQQLQQQRPDVCFCLAWQLGPQLRQLGLPYVLDYQGPALAQLSLSQLYDLQWAVILAQSVTRDSLHRLQSLLPTGFPIWKPYLVSLQQPLETPADFVKQTLFTLQQAGRLVIVGQGARPPTSVPLNGNHFPRICLDPPPLASWLPYPVQLLWKKGWQWWIRWRLQQLQQALHGLIFWAFDPDDWQRWSVLPTGTFHLYDCVDYFSSRDPDYHQRLQRQQQHILDQAELLCVNSSTLAKLHRRRRPDLEQVPQGFDWQTAQRIRSDYGGHQRGQGRSLVPTADWARQLHEQQRASLLTVTYLGLLSHRVDYRLLTELTTSCPQVTFCLPQTQLDWPVEDQHHPWRRQLDTLRQRPNVVWYPRLSRDQAFRLLSDSDLGLIPYDLNLESNRYCFPMKLLEHFWVGLPTLATPLAELEKYRPYVRTGRTAQQLARQLEWWQAHPLTVAQKAEMRAIAASHSWQHKVAQIENLIDQRLRPQLQEPLA